MFHVFVFPVFVFPVLVFPVFVFPVLVFPVFVIIFVTVTSTEPVFPAPSWKRNTPVPLTVKVMVVRPELLVIVMGSDSPVRVAVTDPVVVTRVEYTTVAVGGVRSGVSIMFTVLVIDQVFPARSVYS